MQQYWLLVTQTGMWSAVTCAKRQCSQLHCSSPSMLLYGVRMLEILDPFFFPFVWVVQCSLFFPGDRKHSVHCLGFLAIFIAVSAIPCFRFLVVC